MILTTEAVALHSRRYGDTSRIVVLYTQELGKVSVMARGARTPKSGFGSALEPLSLVRVTFYHRKLRDLHTISAAESIAPGLWKAASYQQMRAAMTVCETIVRTQADEAPSADIFSLLKGTLIHIASEPDTMSDAHALHLRLCLADIMGFGLPQAEVPASAVLKVSIDDGLPRNESAEGIRMTNTVYTALQKCLLGVPTEPLQLSDADYRDVEAFLSTYFSYHLDRRVASRVSDTLRQP